MSLISVSKAEAAGRVVAVVRVPSPWYAPDFLITSRFRKSVPDYERIPGLERKLYILGEDRHFGGIYLWTTRAIADAYYSPAWFQRVRNAYNVEADLRVWAAPLVVEGSARLNGTPLSERATSGLAYVTLTRFAGKTGVVGEGAAASLRSVQGVHDGLIRSYFLTDEAGAPSVVSLWTAASAARTALGKAWLSAAESQFGGATIERFKAPVQIEVPKIGDEAPVRVAS